MLPAMSSRLMLLDSASLYFRAFFGVPDSVRAPDGTPVNAVRGFLDSIAMLVTGQQPTHLVACWDDDWRPQFRVDAIPSYKAHRVAAPRPAGTPDVEETPDLLDAQVPIIVEVLAALGIARVGAAGYEADDVIGTLSERGAQAGMAVDVVTGDRDLFQLVDDARQVKVLYTAKGGVRNLDVVNEARLFEKYGIRGGRAYAGMAALRGDPSDGLPGVPGIGEKTAAALLGRAGDYDGLMRALAADDVDVLGNSRAKLQAASDYLAVAAQVVDVVRDIAIPEQDFTLPREPADPSALLDLAHRWGLSSSVERVLQAIGWTGD
jgi:5'-3' exonuclease